MPNKTRDAAKERFWRDALQRFAASGLGVRGFCRRENLAESAFYAWRRTIAQRDRSSPPPPPTSSVVSAKAPGAAKRPHFLPVLVSDPAPRHAAITLELLGGRVLRLPESIAAERLADLVAALEARSTR